MAKLSSQEVLEPMSESELLGVVNGYVSDGMDFQQSKLSDQISKSIRYYYGEALGNEVKGRSQVVSKDVADAVDWIMPSLMRIFAGDNDVVSFVPKNESDVDIAKQAHDYVNYLYNTKNNGFVNTYTVIQDSLLAKNGVMKHYYKESIEVSFDNYTGLSLQALEILLLEEGSELAAKTDNEDGSFDVKISKQETSRNLVIEPIPPEEFIIDTWSASINDATFVGHKRGIKRSDLIASGFDPDLVSDLNADGNSALRGGNGNAILRARHSLDDAQRNSFSTPEDSSQEEILVTEGIVQVDFDGDGIAERRRIIFTEDTILLNEEFDEPMFTDFRSHIIGHKFYGLSMYDQLKDIQKLKTTLMRNILDNMYTLNNGRFEVIDGQVNMDDLLHNKLGGVVRTKMAGALKQLDTPAMPVQNFTMLDYLDKIKDGRAGVSDTTKGMDGSVLHSNQASGAVSQLMSAAEQKQELIARILANSFAELFSNIYKLTVLHQDEEEVFQVSGNFVTVNPANWRKNYDVRPVAGIGNNRSTEKEMAAQKMMQLQQMIVSNGGMDILTDWDKTYNVLTTLTKQSGFIDSHNYWINPQNPKSQQKIKEMEEAAKKPSPEEIRAQAEMQAMQARVQIEQAKTQADIQNDQQELALKQRELAVKERELDLKQQEIDIDRYEAEVKHAALVAETALEQQRGSAVSLGDQQIPNISDGDL